MLMLFAIYLCAAHGMKISLTRDLRHPLLWAVVVFGFAHILVNGDTASFVLFGGVMLWAFLQMAVINQAEPSWVKPPLRQKKFEVIAVFGTFVIASPLVWLHYLLGYQVIG